MKKSDVVEKVLALIPPLCYMGDLKGARLAPTLYNRVIYFLDGVSVRICTKYDTEDRMKKEIKNPRGMTVEFRLEVANALREFCSKTDIPLTRVVNNAVEAYMPRLKKIMEAMNGVDTEDSEQKLVDYWGSPVEMF